MSQPYVDGITDTVPHQFASSLTAGQIAVGEDTVSVSVVCPDRWFLGDFAVVTSRDGRAFAGEVEGMDVCTGEITIRGAGQLTARTTSLRGLRSLRGPGAAPEVPARRHQRLPATGTSRCTRPVAGRQPAVPLRDRYRPAALILPEPSPQLSRSCLCRLARSRCRSAAPADSATSARAAPPRRQPPVPAWWRTRPRPCPW
jgi:hypothetical protein